MVVALEKNQLRAVLARLDDVRMEILRLRAQLLAAEQPNAKERREINQARKEISRGRCVPLTKLLRELGE